MQTRPLNKTPPRPLTETAKPVAPSTVAPTPAEAPATTTKKPATTETTAFKSDGTTTKQEAQKVPTTSGQPVKGGVLGFLLAQKTPASVFHTGAEILEQVRGNPAMTALLTLRVKCPPEYAPLVELTKADGTRVSGSLKGVDDQGRAVVDTGLAGKVFVDVNDALRSVRHQMDTDGDLHTALVSVFDEKTWVTDPWQLQGFVGKTLSVETWDKDHKDLATAAKKGDVSERPLQLTGVTKDGLDAKGGKIGREFWEISRISLEQPAYSYKKDGVRLSDVGEALAAGTAVDVVFSGGRSIKGSFLGVAKDTEGADYIVVQEKNGVRHALRDLVDVKADACTLPLWQAKDRAAVYG